MNRIWSDNKYLDLLIDILIFLTGINFLHYGQLILPVICFLLFIDHKMTFHVHDPLVFIILCLFGVSFYAFSDKNFYCVMGFTCPMAYYIGCNMRHPNESNVKKIIYLLALSMGLHIILSSIYEFIVHGSHGFFHSGTHYDIWTREKISNTVLALNIDLLAGSLYYLFFHEKEKKIRYLSFLVFAAAMFYLIVIGRRTPFMLLGIASVLSFVYEVFILKSGSAKLRKSFLLMAGILVLLVGGLIVFYSFDLLGCRDFLDDFYIIQKFSQHFFSDKRIELYLGALRLMPQYLWGHQQISTVLGEQVHDFWIDIYDYAGIVSYLLMMAYSVLFVRDVFRFFTRRDTQDDFRILMIGVLSCVVIQMFLEPVMTGASLFLLIGIIIHGLLEGLIHEQ
ncbi:MAG: hypothetical protein IJL85_06330 [Erysipelotrichaceae bacterium]|nr:hypothetical protein [Erysipelotrichaceae bacterium]